MNSIRFHLARQVLASLLALAALSTRVESQAPYASGSGPTLEAARVGVSFPARATSISSRTEGAPLNRVGNVVVSAAAGALAGLIVYSISVGALASDHGAPYKRERRRWIIGGAVIGALLGVFSPPPPRVGAS